MTEFRIVSNEEQIPTQGWKSVTNDKHYKKNDVYDKKGKPFSTGSIKYRVIDIKNREYTNAERLGRLCLGILLSLPLVTLASSRVIRLLTSKEKVVAFAEPITENPINQKGKELPRTVSRGRPVSERSRAITVAQREKVVPDKREPVVSSLPGYVPNVDYEEIKGLLSNKKDGTYIITQNDLNKAYSVHFIKASQYTFECFSEFHLNSDEQRSVEEVFFSFIDENKHQLTNPVRLKDIPSGFMNINLEWSEKILKDANPGTYIVRPSSDKNAFYALSYKDNKNNIHKYRILQVGTDKPGAYIYRIEGSNTIRASSPRELIALFEEKYSAAPIKKLDAR